MSAAWAMTIAVLVAGPPEPGHTYEHAAVATDHVVASRAGVEMLRRGGNAVDAAVAAGFCLSVVRPYSCGIGGGGFMLISMAPVDGNAGDAVAIDFRESAPGAVGRDYYLDLGDDTASRAGPHAVGVPGSVAGMLYALERYGTLDRATVLEPAIRAAQEGIVADRSWVENARVLANRLDRHPALRPAAASIVRDLCLDGDVIMGDLVRNPQQAVALRLIAEHGRESFYAGPIADAMVRAVQAGGGPLTRADLAAYRVRVSAPLRGSFRGREILTMPPPSSGGIAMLQVLAIVDRRLGETRPASPGAPAYVHLLTEAMKHAFADRATWLADSAFVDVPTDRLLDKAYLDERAASIVDRTQPLRHYGSHAPPGDDGGTSHYSIVDGRGMAVACTQTINLEYGSLVAVPGFGFMLNDEMDDFTTISGRANEFGLQQSDRNLPEPGKRPLSSMSPTIVRSGDGRPLLVAGASGGPRIISGTLQCVLNCLVFGMTPRNAVAMPRFHHQWQPDVLYFEERWSDDATVEAMRSMGHEPGRRKDVGIVQLITVDDDGVRAASDPRKGGVPDGM